MKPIITNCGHGLRQILDYESNLRRYSLKMSFICSEENLDGTVLLILLLAPFGQGAKAWCG